MVRVTDVATGQELACWWDDAAWQLVEDGFLNPKDWRGSAERYLWHLGVIGNAE